ncbi:class I SAM-dependent DNA methyltransferase [Dietzia cinnamea]|uniref:site-specific DNA-methyltransferase (adenine-specific) n=1 Tax=Dietzia cinnamea TaxID=321318 RepID=A0ABV3YD03_9ACTN|nr:restriction endonuclease subunit M [Dietzia cinnamea]
MAADSAIVNVDEWISEHYLTTDETKQSYLARVRALVKGWKQDAGEGAVSPLKRLTSARQSLLVSLSQLSAGDEGEEALPASEEDRAELRRALGYGTPGDHSWTRGETTWHAQAWAGDGVVLLEVAPVDTVEDLRSAPVLGEVSADGKPMEAAVGKVVGELFVSDAPPAFVAVLAGRWFLLAERESWPLGRFLAVDLLLALERGDTRSGGEIERVLAAVCRESLERRPDGTVWWTETLEDSRQHSVKVSESLRGAVRESIEIIANDVLDRRRARGMSVEDVDGQVLARQSLRYLYRILFLLFAEASPELKILPVGSTEYDDGYGLTRLRDQILSPPATPREEQGTYLYDSLSLLFRLVDGGHHPVDEPGVAPGLEFNELSADLFSPVATSLIDEVQLSNMALYRVLGNLLLTPEQPGKDRGFISYATLGVTELGQVYEGLMSYTGFIATEDLWEVARGGDDSKGSWVVNHADSLEVSASDRVVRRNPVTGEDEWVRHPRGSFVFRQSSRDRERSASFYTPQVLSEFVVGQAIEELEATGRIDRAEDILTLSICEPAMGSGAFAVEAVRQLAELYLERRQRELGTEIDPEQRTAELQKVKAYLALHRVYGVDLNATAVELAEIALWLDTMTPGLKAPWFGLHLRRGNSLIGARRATYAPTQVEKKQWLTAEPQDAPLSALAAAVDEESGFDPSVRGRIHHFLLPAAGWGAAADAKDLAPYVGEAQKELKAWRKQITAKPTKTQVQRLTELSERAEKLWQLSLVRMRIAEDQVRREIDVYGAELTAPINPVPRAEIERSFADRDSAFRRLRLAMDAWCALWFWPLTQANVTVAGEKVEPPTLEQWIGGLEALLGRAYSDTPKGRGRRAPGEGQIVLGSNLTWEQIDQAEDFDRVFAGEKPVETVLANHLWLSVCEQVTRDQGFFHWELDFATVFAADGFDLQVGNPPWVRPRTDEDALWGETDPWWILAHKPTQAAKAERRELTVTRSGAVDTFTTGIAETVVTSKYLNDTTQYPLLTGQQPDLYRAFIQRAWRSAGDAGIVTLIHPESHLTEKDAVPLRRASYLRLRRHWKFNNDLQLFDIGKSRTYGIHIYGSKLSEPTFLNASNLVHPKTVIDSISHDGTGPLPGHGPEASTEALRPHRDRISTIRTENIEVWHKLLEESATPILDSRIVYTTSNLENRLLSAVSSFESIDNFRLYASRCWDESIDKKKGFFETEYHIPATWKDVILLGRHISNSNPLSKYPALGPNGRERMLEVDLEAIGDHFIPGVSYRPTSNLLSYNNSFPKGKNGTAAEDIRDRFRLAWRTMAANDSARTLFIALIPPLAGHINGMHSATTLDTKRDVLIATAASSLLVDFQLRSLGILNIYNEVIGRMHFNIESEALGLAASHFLRLNCLTEAYAPLWEECTGTKWSKEIPLRAAEERRKAEISVDVLVAISLGVGIDDLCNLFRSHFSKLARNESRILFDSNGRKVRNEIIQLERKLRPGQELSVDERTWTHPQSGATYVFEYPFRTLDRETDMRAAYERFERELAEGTLR